MGTDGAIPEFNRPGITDRFIHNHGIKFVTAEQAQALTGTLDQGIYIPYTDHEGQPKFDGGKQYGRLRRTNPVEKPRYHQQSKTGVHPFFPKPTIALEQSSSMIIIEGEFKALCLAEQGFPVIGIAGFWGFGYKEKTENEFVMSNTIEALLLKLGVTNIYFIGDSDTTLNHSFSQAAIRLRSLLRSNQRLILPRLPMDGVGKGLDDICGEIGPDKFRDLMFSLRNEGHTVLASSPDELCYDLIERDESGILAKCKTDKEFVKFVQKRSCKIAAQMKSPATADRILKIAKQATGIGIGTLRDEVTSIRAKLPKEEIDFESSDIELYYDPTSCKFFALNDDGKGYLEMNQSLALTYLATKGYSKKPLIAGSPSPAEIFVIDALKKNQIYKIDRLAGYKMGPHRTPRGRMLVLNSPVVPKVEKGEWKDLKEFIETLFRNDPEQITYVHGWTQVALKSFLSFDPKEWRRSQAVYLTGPINCGKSLFQDFITYLLGGEAGKPLKYLTGETSFNGDMCENVHLKMEDEQSSTAYKDRREFGTQLKALTTNVDFDYHDKGARKLPVKLLARITISINDETENLQIIPPLDPSLQDKISVLHCQGSEHFKNPSPSEVLKYMDMLRSQLPAYAYWLLNEFVIPDEVAHSRTGIKAHRSKHIMDLLNQQQPENQLMSLIQAFFNDPETPVDIQRYGLVGSHECSSLDLLNHLTQCPSTRLEAQRRKAVVVGHHLSALARKWEGKPSPVVSKRIVRGTAMYSVHPVRESVEP